MSNKKTFDYEPRVAAERLQILVDAAMLRPCRPPNRRYVILNQKWVRNIISQLRELGSRREIEAMSLIPREDHDFWGEVAEVKPQRRRGSTVKVNIDVTSDGERSTTTRR